MKFKILILFTASCLLKGSPALAIGEKYSKQGAKLGQAISKNLVGEKICKEDSSDCARKLSMYGGHGDRVNFSIYAPDKKAQGRYRA